MYTLRAGTLKNQMRYEQCCWKMGTAGACGGKLPNPAKSWQNVRGKVKTAKTETDCACHSVPDRDGAVVGVAGRFVGCSGAQHAGVGHAAFSPWQHAQVGEAAGREPGTELREAAMLRRATRSRAAAFRIGSISCTSLRMSIRLQNYCWIRGSCHEFSLRALRAVDNLPLAVNCRFQRHTYEKL